MAAVVEKDRGKAFVHVLSCVLSRLVAANDGAADAGPVTKFHALRPPSISIFDYCSRVHKYASTSPECFVLALVYIDRLIQRNSLLLTSLNVHRIIITAIMLAAKFFDDQYFNNAYYAKVGGVPTVEVNALELEFLFSINFSLHVPTAVYEKYYSELANHMGVGVPPELMTGNTCDCMRWAEHIAYTPDELRHTGMKSLDAMAAESLAAFMGATAAGSDGGAGDDEDMMGGTGMLGGVSGGGGGGMGMDVDASALSGGPGVPDLTGGITTTARASSGMGCGDVHAILPAASPSTTHVCHEGPGCTSCASPILSALQHVNRCLDDGGTSCGVSCDVDGGSRGPACHGTCGMGGAGDDGAASGHAGDGGCADSGAWLRRRQRRLAASGSSSCR